MDTTLSERVEAACREARRIAAAYQPPAGRDNLPWKIIRAFDDTVRGAVERDRRIEDERDRVLITAVKLAETPAAESDDVAGARAHLVEAIDYLEQAVLRFGIPNHQRKRS